jgi:hypothetical protein
MLSFASEIIRLDWRTPSADFSDSHEQKDKQMRYKGGSGYSEVWKDLVELFQKSSTEDLHKNAELLSNYID